jgi:hypothetical protein
MKDFVKRYGGNHFSQNGEDHLLAEVLLRIKMKTGIACEMGGADGFYCSNTAMLREKGWKVFMYDLQACPPHVEQKVITEQNINELPECNVLSIDVDGIDLSLWKAYKGTPEIVVIEINSSLPPMTHHYSVEKGSSYVSMVEEGIKKGYFLLCHTGNLIFILDKYRPLFPEIKGDGLQNHQEYFNTSWQ